MPSFFVACLPRTLSALHSPHRRSNRPLHILHLTLRLIRIPRPEEPLQAVLFTPRHHMDVKMRHTLAHTVIDRDKRPFRLHRRLDRRRQEPRILEQRAHQLMRQLCDEFVVLPGHK